MYPENVDNIPGESAEELYEHAPCGYMSTLPDGTIIRINATMLAWTRYTIKELLHVKKFQHLLPVGGKIFYETHHAPLLQMQGFVKELNYDILRKDQSRFPSLVNSVEVKDKEGNVILIRTTIVDITERKKYEKELLEAKRKAEEASRVKAEFLSTVSHEIRTPMNAVMGIATLLSDSSLSEDQKELVGLLKSSSAHLLNLINDVLDFSKIESGKITLEHKIFNLRELINNIFYSLRIKASEKNLLLRLHVDENIPPQLTGDPVKLGQVLTNLIGNAIKFTNQGFVEISIRLKEPAGDLACIDFSVKDTGIGISLDKQQYIFEEFTQASYEVGQQYGGTGLGLAISRKLLELYGSSLSVQSILGQGSLFSFTLTMPVARTITGKTLLSQKNLESRSSLQGIRLLIAEDNEVNVMVLSQFLKKWGAVYEVVSNGKLAVEKVRENKYDLLLMDLQMPEMDGYEATRLIRQLPGKAQAELPIIALSASSRIEMQERIEQAGMNAFVGKPFNPQELFQAIARHTSHVPESQAVTSQITEPQKSSTPERKTLFGRTSISLNQFIAVTENNPGEIKQLIEMSIKAFTGYKKDFTEALSTADLPSFKSLEHKIKMTLTILEARHLQELIYAAEKMLQVNAGPDEIGRQKMAIQQEVDVIITELHKHIQPG